jgi:hypothetical protein
MISAPYGIKPGRGGEVMKAITAGIAAGAAALALITAPTTSADPTPTPPPTPGYTWECDTDALGHTSCNAVAIPKCVWSADRTGVVPLQSGTDYDYGQIPAPCNSFGPGGALVSAPYPSTFPTPTSQGSTPGPGYRDGD